MAEIADATPVPDINALTLEGADHGPLPKTVAPLLATRVQHAPKGTRWLHEIKFDGYRLMARLEGDSIQLLTRNGHDWHARFMPLCRALRAHVPCDALLDGELVALDADGISRFGLLQDAIAGAQTQGLVYQLFDLLHIGGIDLRGVALTERKRVLASLLTDAPAMLRYTDHVVGQGPAFFKQARASGLEGIISKRVDSRYVGGRQTSWRKTKWASDDTFVIGGWSEGKGHRKGAFGALLLGETTSRGALRYVGRVGSGFSDRQLAAIGARLADIARDTSPFADAVPAGGGVHWVHPRIRVDTAFAERTGAGLLRQARFRGLRDDLAVPELDADSEAVEASASSASDAKTGAAAPSHLPLRGRAAEKHRIARVAGVRLTHPDRLIFQDPAIRKQELAEYMVAAAGWILPGLACRPLSLLRSPDGRTGECFFQKHPREAVPDAVPRIELEENDHQRTGVYIHVHDAADLVRLVQAGTIEMHPWNARIDAIERPDRLVFDLDPGESTDWADTRRVAHALRERIRALGLVPFLRLTGGRGVHLVVPIERRLGWDQAKAFARAICHAHARSDPQHTTIQWTKAKRRGRLFLDYLRNGRGATAIASYSPRARAGAGVAIELRWDELAADRRSDHYDPGRTLRRLAALRDDPWADFESSRRRVTRAMQRAVGLD